MAANFPLEEKELLDGAISWFQSKLPPTWSIQISNQAIASPDPSRPPSRVDAVLDLQAPGGGGNRLVVEAKRSLTPRDVERLFSGLSRRLRALNSNTPILAVAPWISARTQEALIAEDVNFVDLTGNARISLMYPPLFISSQGASRDPAPVARGKASVRGPKAGRLVRLLLDVAPPYNVSQIAKATRLAPGYVSRLLDALDSEALIERERRGQVTSVDVPGLIRRWTESYDVLKTNVASSFVVPNGPQSILDQLAESPAPMSFAITGSFAAVRSAPVAAPALLAAYCDDVDAVATQLNLLPSDRGSNVVLLRPFDTVIWDRTTIDKGLTYVAAAQIAIDCLTGTGRMPAEGEAMLTWMEEDESRWRLPSLKNFNVDMNS